ncbi:MAG TPA: sarcosine oxidase subunit gamma family protein [Acetobacteraceae bacterium]|nr:sarcosine oxidase subunit gamma family protein [Acetobacteraceae bacterium]
MADLTLVAQKPPRLAPLAAHAGDPRARPLGPMARFSLRLRETALPSAATAIGLDLAQPINRAISHAGCSALHLGPDEWLVLAPEEDGEAIAAALDRAVSSGDISLVDIGHRQTGILLAGEDAASMLNAACPLDLDLAAFPVGMASRTVFAKAEIILWRLAMAQFHIEVWRSYAPYVWALLREIGREYPV